jgi:hypothetical protein
MSFENLWVVIDQSEAKYIPFFNSEPELPFQKPPELPFRKPFVGEFENSMQDFNFPNEPQYHYPFCINKQDIRLIGIYRTREMAEDACDGYLNRRVLGPTVVKPF